ncbi:hypothetical protein VTH06DRAFT_5452 [Thermothelomyces fergusii]
MASINKHPNRFELTAVYQHPQAKADIVLVHGLNGAPDKTWTAPNGVYWPTDLLPASLKDQHANVLVYGYNADVYAAIWERHTKNPSDNFIHHHAQTLVATLTHYRKSVGTERSPIIWVAHSLGGIVTKRALLYSNDVRDPNQEDLRSIYVSTFGIIFLGTPHNGAIMAGWGETIQRMVDAVAPRKMFDSESVLLKSLKKDNETLQEISNHFLDIYQKFKIHMAHETQKTDLKGTKMLVVDAPSASPQLVGVTYYGIEATHSRMCKFDSENAPGYRTISTAIREWVADAPNVIPIRWEVEEDHRRVRANLENFERSRQYRRPALVPPDRPQTIARSQPEPVSTHLQQPFLDQGRPTSAPLITEASTDDPPLPQPLPQPSPHIPKPLPVVPDLPGSLPEPGQEPLFIHPETFRPNSYFVGREDELRGLHEMLMDRKRRSEGTSAVLIQCLPGGGKTHLARQYVFQHRSDYPGGVYWVRADSRQELEYWFWRIARNEALRGLVDQKDVDELRDPKKIVQIVRRWLNSQSDWLMVLDGVQFDTPGLHEFIPDARNTSLIYTSTERAVTGDPRFDNPQVMELGLLTAQEAQHLLLLELERKQPWTAEDQDMALELVGLMGRLPLMVHVAAQHIKATREPLARYLRSYRSRPKAGHLPAYRAVREQLENRGEYAALNLMSLLVFFDQHIPVELLVLGLSALDKVTPVKTLDAMHRKPSLDNTLKVLIAFGLIERSESDDISPTSSRSSSRSFDRHADYLDVLRIHSVVQAFFIDSLYEQRQIPFWLQRAVAVWARSYDEADRRIQEDPRVGLPDDYRRFCIHGEKLLKNLNRFEKRYPKLAVARSHLEERLQKIQGQIDDLSHAIQKNIVDGSVEEYPASVFDRISASSQSDTATMQSHGSQLSGMASGESSLVQSPVSELLEQEVQPVVPYPTTPSMPEVPEMYEDDDQDTIALSMVGTQVHVGATDEVASLPPDPRDDHHLRSSFDDWRDAIPRDRVITRQEARRYRDRAGSWRDKTISDPRVGLNREVALGSISGTRDASGLRSKARLTAQSEAEMRLSEIKKAAPLSPHQGEGFSSQIMSRPNTLLGRNSWSLPQAQKPSETEVAQVLPNDSSGGAKRVSLSLSSSSSSSSSPRSWTEATLKLLKKTVLPSNKRTEKESRPQQHQHQHQHQHQQQRPQQPGVLPEDMVSPTPIVRGSRSTNSSPAGATSPFLPPPHTSVPTADLFARTERSGPLVVRRWDTVIYPVDGAPVTSTGIESFSTVDPVPPSYPSLLPSRHQQLDPRSQDFLRGNGARPPTGYSSQPMSRDGSQQSNPGIDIHIPEPARAIESPASHSSSPSSLMTGGSFNAVQQRHSPTGLGLGLPPASASSGSLPIPIPPSFSSHLTPFARTSQQRPPSFTQTEPSPRIDSAFPDIDTSYHQWERHYHWSQHRAGTSPAMSTEILPPAASRTTAGNWMGKKSAGLRWRPSTRGTRFLPIRGARAGSGNGKAKGGKGRRAHSHSPPGSPGTELVVGSSSSDDLALSSWPSPPAAFASPPPPPPPRATTVVATVPPLVTSSPTPSSSSSFPSSLTCRARSHGHGRDKAFAPKAKGLNTPPPPQQQYRTKHHQHQHQHHPPTERAVPPTRANTSVAGGEDTVQPLPAAGGIRIDDGTVVEFGSPVLGSYPS